MKNSPYKAEILLGFNILLALSMLYLNPKLSIIYSIIIVVYGLYRIISRKNADGSAHLFAAYVVGIEILFRMNSGAVGYEFGKYAALLFLISGIIVEIRKRKVLIPYVMFIFLLLPSILILDFYSFNSIRQMVSFNLSGPITLGVSAIYFYKRKFNVAQLRKVFLNLLYPITAMSVFLYFRTGDLEDITFTTESNFRTSGGFGPNQVSTIFGLGILVIAASYFLGIRLFRVKYLNIILAFTFLVRGLVTFSRGGMIAPLIAIILCVVIMTLTDKKFKLRMNRFVYAYLVIFVIGFLGFNYVNDVSGGLLEMRYKGESMYNPEKSNLYSGREGIFKEDLEVFSNNILAGVGPGMSDYAKFKMGGAPVGAHIEFSRILAEHGLFGAMAILIMVLYPIKTFLNLKSSDDKILLIICVVFAFITMSHAAMRTAAPGFMYGLAFINLVRNKI